MRSADGALPEEAPRRETAAIAAMVAGSFPGRGRTAGRTAIATGCTSVATTVDISEGGVCVL